MPVRPRKIAPFTGSFQNIGDPDEEFKVVWTDDDGISGIHTFNVGTDLFLENASQLSSVPNDQLIASLSMAAILAGEVLPGTAEFNNEMGSNQLLKNYQTIVGDVQLGDVTLIDDPAFGPDGKVFDVEFLKTGQNNKIVRTDAHTLSAYSSRLKSTGNPDFSFAVMMVPAAIHKEFGYKKSDLGAAGSTQRNNVVNFLSSWRFWV